MIPGLLFTAFGSQRDQAKVGVAICAIDVLLLNDSSDVLHDPSWSVSVAYVGHNRLTSSNDLHCPRSKGPFLVDPSNSTTCLELYRSMSTLSLTPNDKTHPSAAVPSTNEMKCKSTSSNSSAVLGTELCPLSATRL